MRLFSVPQPWATLLSRGAARFVVREDATDYRGTVAIHASDFIDAAAVERLETDPEFAERMAAQGFNAASDFDALPCGAIIGVAVIADLWSLGSLEEVATEDDAILIGDVDDTAVFWELAEAVEIDAIGEPAVHVEEDEDHDTNDASPADDIDDPAMRFEPLSEPLVSVVQDAARRAGARFDDDDLVFWPVAPSASLAALIGDDVSGDRGITQRVWAYVVEHDLQDPEDHAYVYLDDALRSALDSDADGMPTGEFTERIVAQMRRIP